MSKLSIKSRVCDVYEDPAGHDYAVRLAKEYFPGYDLDRMVEKYRFLYNLFKRMTVRNAFYKAKTLFPKYVPDDVLDRVEKDLAQL